MDQLNQYREIIQNILGDYSDRRSSCSLLCSRWISGTPCFANFSASKLNCTCRHNWNVRPAGK